MAKRRFISQLPAVFQTQTLQKFFSATVDQLFQPGVTDSLNALIGRKPSYFNALKDFYKQEVSAERQFYQLEAAMTAKAVSTDEYSDLLFYQDLVNNLRFQGANVDNHSRLFESDFYSWCPPIDVNKLVNYRQYYWMPDGPPVLVINVPVGGASKLYVGDGVNNRFAIPYGQMALDEDLLVKRNGVTIGNDQFNKVGTDIAIVSYNNQTGTFTEDIPGAGELIQVWLNGAYVANGFVTAFDLPPSIPGAAVDVEVHSDRTVVDPSAYTVTATQVIFNTPPAAGSAIKVWVNANFAQNITGQSTFTLSIPGLAYASQTQFNELTATYETLSFPEVELESAPALERYMRVEIRDSLGKKLYQVYRTNNQAATLYLGEPQSLVDRNNPLHTCLERGSELQSPWARANHWYHQDLVFYFYDNYKPKRATRPIIEFEGDLQLFNYGLTRLADVNSIVTAIAEDPLSFNGWNSALVAESNNRPIVTIDGLAQNLPMGRVMFRNNPSNGGSAIQNQILEIKLISTTSDIPAEVLEWDSAIIAFAPVEANQPGLYVGEGDDLAVWSNWDNDGFDTDYIVSVSQPHVTAPQDIFKMVESATEYLFDGTQWVVAQNFGGTFEPLFQLYDSNSLDRTGINPVAFSDTAVYPGTSFQGSKIFAFSHGTGANDSVLGFPLTRNKYGNLEFTDHMTDAITWNGGTVPGFKYYSHFASNGQGGYTAQTLGNSWQVAGASSQAKGEEGFYEIPFNLQGNPLNENLSTISLNDWNQHFKPVIDGNNWNGPSAGRDLSLGRKIMQHRSPLLRTMLMNSNANLDYSKASIYNEREYTRYRNKFLQALKVSAQQGSIKDVRATLTAIMTQLRLAKTSDFPFANSGMAGGEWFIPNTGASLGATSLYAPELIIETSRVKDSQIVMLRGHDGSLTPGFSRGDSTNPITTQNFDDRDLVLLGLENLIYQNINVALKTQRRPLFDLTANIPGRWRTADYTRAEVQAVERPIFERWASQSQFNYRENTGYDANNPWTFNYRNAKDASGANLPGNWRGIYRWFFDTERPHTHPWEMLGFTIKPTVSTAGWDWDSFYSWTDAAKRQHLIEAIVNGRTHPVAGTSDRAFARSGFASVIPVDAAGELLSPLDAGIIAEYGDNVYDMAWEFGDCSPVESTWRTAQSCSFSQSQLSYLLKPVRFVESNWNTLDEILVHGTQWVSPQTFQRTFDTSQVVHNELVNKSYVRKLGIQTQLSDYIRSQGRDVTTVLGDHVRTLGVNLAHKLGGFVDPSGIKAYTENTGMIPQEDVLVALYRSPSIREEFYGGVITEWTGSGWRLAGYDLVDPAFKIKPVQTTGRRVKVQLGDVTDISVDWKPSTYYMVNTQIYYSGTNYTCDKTHTSSDKFEVEYWTAVSVGRIDPSTSAVWYLEHHDEVERVGYGTILKTRQEVAEFLSGYQAYLESRGWVFDAYDNDLNENKDFKYSLREFLYWSMSKWDAGNFITLSPISQGVKFSTTYGTVQNVEQLVNGVYSIVDRAGMAIPPSKVTSNRLDDEITVGTTLGGIFGLRLYISEVEQALVFNNNTIFGDTLYDPQFDLRQNRIRLLADLSQGWVGRLDAPGFIITDNRLMPSFEQQVQDIRYMYDIESAINLPLRDNARHQIGYQSRDYLQDLMFNDVNQFEFYQGMIKQKGAPGVFSKLLRNDQLTATRQLSFLEEWAFRTGVYGATDKYQTFEFLLSKYQVKAEPQLIQFNDAQGSDADDDKVINLYTDTDSRWITPKTGSAFTVVTDFTRNKDALPTAGYARVTDTQFQATSLNTFNAAIKDAATDVKIGDRIWIYVNDRSNWSILRASLPYDGAFTTTQASEIQSFTLMPTGTRFDILGATNIKAGDYVYLSQEINATASLGGIHKVVEVLDGNGIVLDFDADADYVYQDTEEKPTIMRMVDVRVTTNNHLLAERVSTFTTQEFVALTGLPTSQLIEGELVYVDVCYDIGYQNYLDSNIRRWAVYMYQSGNMVVARTQPAKIRRDLVRDVKLYETIPQKTTRVLNSKPLLNSEILILDPNQGMVAGEADKEIWYKLESDPAEYNAGPAGDQGVEWGPSQVGRLWWDLSTTRYLISETSSVLDDEELKYRSSTWSHVAPGSSVEVYEWSKSSITPSAWQTQVDNGTDTQTYDGVPYGGADANYVEGKEWNESLGQYQAVYYFWIKNRIHTPSHLSFRNVAASTVAAMLTNPLGQGLSWIAPLSANSLITSGLTQYLSPTSSLQIQVAKSDGDAVRHVEWQLMRKGDERSLPASGIWTKLVTSLTGRDVWGSAVPSTARYYTDRVGFDVENGQNMFKNIANARKHLVNSLNNLFSATLISDERRDLSVLTLAEGSSPELHWYQVEDSYYVKPIPHANLWANRISTINQVAPPSNLSGAALTAWKARMNYDVNPQANYTAGDSLLRNLQVGEAYWSVTNQSNGAMHIAKMYDYTVASVAERDSLVGVTAGQRVKVFNDPQAGGLWTLWAFNGSNYTFVQQQRYDTKDAWSLVDWYGQGFTAVDEPKTVFASVTARDDALGANPVTKIVKILNDGKNRWMWTEYQDGVWVVVAKQNGTLTLSDNIWKNTGNYLDGSLSAATATRDLGYELNFILNQLRDEILTDEELNAVFFAMIEHAHAEQDFVDWAFKTSFMNVTGYGDKLTQDPVAYKDLTSNLLSYINEVKPYHVKVRDYISKYQIGPDMANTKAWDYDKSVYVNSSTLARRVLNPGVASDLAILATGKWAPWLDQWNLVQQGVNDYMPLARKINITAAYMDGLTIRPQGSVRIRAMNRGDSWAPAVEQIVVQATQGRTMSVTLAEQAQNRTAIPVFAGGRRVDPDLVVYNASNKTVSVPDADGSQYVTKSFGFASTGYINNRHYFNKASGVQVFTIEAKLIHRSTTIDDLYVDLDGVQLVPIQDYQYAGKTLTVTKGLAGFLTVQVMEHASGSMIGVRTQVFKGAQLVNKTFAQLYPELTNPARQPINNNFIIEVDGVRVQPELTQSVMIGSRLNHVMLERNAPISDLSVWFNGVAQTITDSLWKPYVMPSATRSVTMDFASVPQAMTVKDANSGATIVVGELISNATGLSLDPSHLQFPTLGVDWTMPNQGWMDVLSTHHISPSNAEYLMVANHLVSYNATSDRALLISFDNILPEDLTGYQSLVAGATVAKFDDRLVWMPATYGHLTVRDTAGEFQITDLVQSRYTDAQMVTITDFQNSGAQDVRTHSYQVKTHTAFPISAMAASTGAYWVTVNGIHMVEGTDYVVEEYPYDWDDFSWDAESWVTPHEFYNQGLVAGQYTGDDDGYRNFHFPSAVAGELIHKPWRGRKWDHNMDYDREVAVIRFTNYVVQQSDNIIATVISAQQSTQEEQYQLFVKNSEAHIAPGAAVSSLALEVILPQDVYVLAAPMTADQTTATLTHRVIPGQVSPTIGGSGLMWIDSELVVYSDANYNPSTGVVTLTGISRGQEITAASEHSSGVRCVITNQLAANVPTGNKLTVADLMPL